MPFISNQWLVGAPERRRGHFPVTATLHVDTSRDDWCQRHNIVAAFQIAREDGDFMELLLQPQDAIQLASLLASAVPETDRIENAIGALSQVESTAFLSALERVFALRARTISQSG